jgi:CheY-like chemotaxis protein
MNQQCDTPGDVFSIHEKKRSILILDDEQGWRDLLSYELGELGCQLTFAVNAAQGLELLSRQSFDLIITDVRLRGSMDGIDFVNVLRMKRPDQKVIFITGYALEEKISRVFECPLNLCLKKPFPMETLYSMISRCFCS